MLNRLGLSHTNEKQLEMGLLVDIFIPPSSFKRLNTTTHTADSNCNGNSSGGRCANKSSIGDVTRTAHSSDGTTHRNSDNNDTVDNNCSHAADRLYDKSYVHNDSDVDDCRSMIREGGRGVVIEIDGPSHFDSYLQVSFTLSTLLTYMPSTSYSFDDYIGVLLIYVYMYIYTSTRCLGSSGSYVAQEAPSTGSGVHTGRGIFSECICVIMYVYVVYICVSRTAFVCSNLH